MDSKQAWGLKEEKKRELRAWRERRAAAKARGEVDVDAHQPLNEPWVWAKTLPLLDGSQLGGAIVPFADEFFAIAAAGIRTGQVTHCLASKDDMQKFNDSQREKKSAAQASQDKIEHRDRIMVQAVPPAPRGTTA